MSGWLTAVKGMRPAQHYATSKEKTFQPISSKKDRILAEIGGTNFIAHQFGPAEIHKIGNRGRSSDLKTDLLNRSQLIHGKTVAVLKYSRSMARGEVAPAKKMPLLRSFYPELGELVEVFGDDWRASEIDLYVKASQALPQRLALARDTVAGQPPLKVREGPSAHQHRIEVAEPSPRRDFTPSRELLQIVIGDLKEDLSVEALKKQFADTVLGLFRAIAVSRRYAKNLEAYVIAIDGDFVEPVADTLVQVIKFRRRLTAEFFDYLYRDIKVALPIHASGWRLELVEQRLELIVLEDEEKADPELPKARIAQYEFGRRAARKQAARN